MKCHECGGVYTKNTGAIHIADKYIGPFTVELAEYWKCDLCKDYLLSPEDTKRIEKAREQALQTILRSQPLSAFWSGGETAAFLEISRQALHKHRRICRGFIFQTDFGGKTVFLRKSVKLFKANGDGRYNLRAPTKEVQYAPKTETVASSVSYSKEGFICIPQKTALFGAMRQTIQLRSPYYA